MKPIAWQQRLRSVLRLIAPEWRSLGALFALIHEDIPPHFALRHGLRRHCREDSSFTIGRWQLFVDTLRRWNVESKAAREGARARDFRRDDTLVRLRAQDVPSTSHEAMSVPPAPRADVGARPVAVERWAAAVVDTLRGEVPADQVSSVLAAAIELAEGRAPRPKAVHRLQ
jgi:hypothetical protein